MVTWHILTSLFSWRLLQDNSESCPVCSQPEFLSQWTSIFARSSMFIAQDWSNMLWMWANMDRYYIILSHYSTYWWCYMKLVALRKQVSETGAAALPKAGGLGQQALSTPRFGSWGMTWITGGIPWYSKYNERMWEILKECGRYWENVREREEISVLKHVKTQQEKRRTAERQSWVSTWQIQRLDEQNAVEVPDPQYRPRSRWTEKAKKAMRKWKVQQQNKQLSQWSSTERVQNWSIENVRRWKWWSLESFDPYLSCTKGRGFLQKIWTWEIFRLPRLWETWWWCLLISTHFLAISCQSV